jgi:hypothetical protein
MRRVNQAVLWGCLGWVAACSYQDLGTNAIPLAFGMSPWAAEAALKAPLERVSGRRGSQIYYAQLPWDYNRQIWLQFRGNRLTGWKNSWPRQAL